MARTHTPITAELAHYIRSITLREPEPLRRLNAEMEIHPDESYQISPEQGQFLHLLVRLLQARKALEIGVFLGYSSSWIALALAEGGTLIACDRNPEYAARARRTWHEAGVEDRIDLRLGPALASLDGLLAAGHAGSFDFVFIDADKGNNWNYYERSLALLRPGGLVAIDNVLWHGRVVDPAESGPDTLAVREFNRKLHADPRVALSMATMGDGIALACKL
jgi:predicted O-methyltransferase YrrM